METGLLIAVLAGLGGMLGWGFADFFAKKTIDVIGDVASLTWGHIFGTLVLIIFAIYEFIAHGHAVVLPVHFATWIGFAFFGALQAAVYLLVYNGFSKGQLALLNPVFSTFSGWVALVSIFIFGEIVTGSLALGLLITFAGVLLLSVDPEALKSRRISFAHIPGFREVAIATLLAALWTLSWSKFVENHDWLSYALFMYAFMTVVLLVYSRIRHIRLSGVPSGIWKFLFLIGLCETVAYLAISLGYSATSHVSIIALLSAGFSLPTIILARIFLKEKVTRAQSLGSLLIIVGIMLLSVL